MDQAKAETKQEHERLRNAVKCNEKDEISQA
jgi:hypothetical protein